MEVEVGVHYISSRITPRGKPRLEVGVHLFGIIWKFLELLGILGNIWNYLEYLEIFGIPWKYLEVLEFFGNIWK